MAPRVRIGMLVQDGGAEQTMEVLSFVGGKAVRFVGGKAVRRQGCRRLWGWLLLVVGMAAVGWQRRL